MPKSFLNEYLTEVIGMPKLSFLKSDKIDNEQVNSWILALKNKEIILKLQSFIIQFKLKSWNFIGDEITKQIIDRVIKIIETIS